ncbi:unnamed protein product [Callosobruchus maculatus]|uniref:Uncharacterized protein n=1 Tax=Callosobruchus maculatus TaxID=64391 RepID=A0A653DLL4_CALMS|nr:unnamed protein product [Callosobruchus maculatus]
MSVMSAKRRKCSDAKCASSLFTLNRTSNSTPLHLSICTDFGMRNLLEKNKNQAAGPRMSSFNNALSVMADSSSVLRRISFI